MTQSLHPSASQGFATSAALYQQVRPDYPDDLRAYLAAHFQAQNDPICLDLGAGTGKFLPSLHAITQQIIAVEPVDEMRLQLEQQFPHVTSLAGVSHGLPLQDQSIDAVFCAQAFHWFANKESLVEIHRVLKTKGYLFFIWNQRDIRVNWVNALADKIQPLEGNTPRYHSGQWQNVLNTSELFQWCDEQQWAHTHVGTVEHVVSKRLLSTSFIAALPSQQQQLLKLEFENIVQHYTGKTTQDKISFPYVTHLYCYQKQN